MRSERQSDVAPVDNAIVLSVSPRKEDHIGLQEVFDRPEWLLFSPAIWVLHPVVTLQSALSVLRQTTVPVVVTEIDLLPGTWKDLLLETVALPNPPLIVVSSRYVDEGVWAEALNLGAYDVLAKPFDMEEVIRVLSFAWLFWKAGRKSKSSGS